MGWNHEMDQHGREVHQVLNRVHGYAGPRTDVDVAMMEGMREPVKRRPVQSSVDPIEVEAGPYRDDDEPKREPYWVRAEHDLRRVPVRRGPPVEDFESGPDSRARSERPEHVVQDLIAESIDAIVAGEIAGVVLEFLPLRGERVEPQVEPAGDKKEQSDVAQPNQRRPVQCEHLHAAPVRLEPIEHGPGKREFQRDSSGSQPIA